ncbi:MAG: hypothetical protein QOG80_2029 [Pseudonocardiales bacterium]|nr:hypothetical protein [Pseudonocardiales bacterium]
MNWGKLALASGALVGAQLLHLVEVIVAGPVSVQGEGGIGEPLGLLGLIGAGMAMIAALNHRRYAIPLAQASGIGVSVGFLLYHGAPIHSQLTNTYWGRGTVLDWAVVLVCVAAGAWCAAVAWEGRATAPSAAVVGGGEG